jgi:HlyD family secretion protein
MKMKRVVFRTSEVRQRLLLAWTSLLIVAAGTGCSDGTDSGYSVMKGPFRQSVIENGELQAVNASVLAMPRLNYVYGSTYKIIYIAGHGQLVKPGDTVVIFDPAPVQKFILERKAVLENEVASVNKLKAQIKNNMQDMIAQVRSEEKTFDMRKLQFERSGFESEGIRRVAELEFRQAEIRLQSAQRKLDLRPMLDSLDLLIQNIRVSQKEIELVIASEAIDLLYTVSPLEGLFVIENNSRTGRPIQAGDDIYLGSRLARIPDVRTMKAKGFVHELDIGKIVQGVNVEIRLDALPSIVFHGSVTFVNRVSVELETRRMFSTEVLIEGSDLRLKPGMTVSCEYITFESKGDVMYVPSECIHEEGKNYYIFVRRRDKVTKTEVETGPSNNRHTIVNGNVREGQELVLPESIINQ